MAGLYDSTAFVPSWARANMEAAGLQPDYGAAAVAPAPLVVSDYSNNESQIARGIRSAFTGAKSSLQGFAGMGAELVGADDYARQLYDYAQANQRLAEEQGPRVRTIRQVMESENPLSAGVDYLAGTVGQVTPYMLLSGAGALAGRGLGLASGLRAGLSGEALAARAASGAGWGGTAAIHPVMAGDQAVQLQEDPAAAGMGVGERALRANVVGGLQSAANALAPAAMVNQTFANGARQAVLPRIVGNMALEGTDEAAEDVIDQLHRKEYDPQYRFNPEQTGENFAAGFFGAAPVAGVHGVATRGVGAAVDGTKALGAGAAWIGEQAYQNMPPQAQKALDYLAKGGEATQEVLDVLAPYGKALVATGKMSADAFMKRADSITDDDSATAKAVKLYTGTIEGAAKAWTGLTRTAEKAADHVGRAIDSATEEGKKALAEMDSPDIPDAVKEHVAQAEDRSDRLLRTAEAFDDLSKWVGENEPMTPKRLRAIDAAAGDYARLQNYANDIVDFIDEVGQDTPAANELREYAKRMQNGEQLSSDDARNFWLKAKLATKIERTSENLEALWKSKGVKMEAKGGTVEVENLSRQGDRINKAVREALANASPSKALSIGIAKRIQTKDIVQKGAERAVREAVTAELEKFGIDPKANQTFTAMFDSVLEAVNSEMESLREEGALPAIMADTLPEGFKEDVRAAFTDMLNATAEGQEILKSEALTKKHLDGLTEYVMKMADGEFGADAAFKLRRQLELAFGKEGVRATTRIIDAATALYSGTDERIIDRLHDMSARERDAAEEKEKIYGLLKRGDKEDLNELARDLEMAYDFDAKRKKLPVTIRELSALKKTLQPGTDRFYTVEKLLKQVGQSGLLSEDVTGMSALKNEWVRRNVVSAAKFERLVKALEKYNNMSGRLDRPEKQTVSHATPANHTAEDENDIDTVQERAETEDTDEEEPIRHFDTDGKRSGNELQEYIEKRRAEKYGQGIEEGAAAQPVFWGANAFDAGGHTTKISAPVSRHESDDRRKTNGAPGTEYNDMVEAAYAKYGHRVTDGHPVSVQRWADEMADLTGKPARKLLNEAMQALLEHDQKRLENPKTSEEDKKWITARADLAARLGSTGSAGEAFFAHKINRNYSYYKMKPADGTNLSYSRDYLERTAALKTRGNHTDDPGVYVERMQKLHHNTFPDKVYENSLLELTTTDGNTITVDVPKLVREALSRHQAAETKGLGEKTQEPNLANDIVTTFHNVMAALMTTDGIAEVGRTFETDDPAGGNWKGKRRPTGDFNTHFDPNLVIFVDPKGTMLQGAEHVLSHSTKRVYTLGDLTKIAGIDPETLRTKYKDKELLSDEAVSTAVRPESRRGVDVAGKAKLGVISGVATQDGKKVSVDTHALLARALERAGMDAHEALQQKNLPEKLAGVLLRDAVNELAAREVEGLSLADTSLDNVVVYYKRYGDEAYPVTLKQLRDAGGFSPKATAPMNLRDAKVQELVEQLQAANRLDTALRERGERKALTADDKDPKFKKVRGAIIDNAYNKSNFAYGTPEGQDYSGAKLRRRSTSKSVKNDRVVSGTIEVEREQGDGPKFSQDEGENMRIQQNLKELGEMAYGDTPLFDKTEAYGTSGGKEWVKQKRNDRDEGEAVERPEVPDHMAALREALIEAASKDPAIKQFIEETFDLSDKDFDEYMEEHAATLNKQAREDNDLGTVERPLPEKTKPLSLTEQRANAKLTVETLATNEAGLTLNALQQRREAAVKQAKAEMEKTIKQEKADARARLDEMEKQAEKVEPEVKAEPEPEPAVDLNAAGSRIEATRALNKMIDPEPFSRQRTVKTPRENAPDLATITKEVERLLGEGKVTVEMPFQIETADGKGASGKYDDKLKKILVSAVAADRMGTAWHETWHRVEDLLGDMGEHGKRVLDEVHKFTSTPMMQNWLKAHYNGDEGVASQLGTASERAAFAFQMFMHDAKMPLADKTTFQKLKDWVRSMLSKIGFGTTTNQERAENFFQYVKDGKFARDVENAQSVRQGLGEKKGDQLMKAAADTLKPVVEGIEKVMQHSSTRVRNLNIPEYTEILETLTGKTGKGGVQLDTHRHRNKFANIVGDILGGKTPEEQYQIFADDGLNGVLTQISKYMADAGVDQKVAMTMLHHVEAFNQDLINDNFEGFVTDLVQHGGFKGKAGEARRIASQIVDDGYFYDPEIKLFENRPDLAEKWMERGMIDKMLRYIDRAVHTAEQTRRFGQTKEYTSPTGLKYKQAEKLHDLLEKGDEKATPEGRKLIRDFIDAQNGQYGGRLSPEMKKLYGGMLFMQNVHILPTAVFSQMLEPMQLALRRNSMRGSLDSLFRGIRDIPKTFDAVNKKVMPDRWEKMMNDVGAAPSRIIRSTMADLMNGIHMHGAVGEANNNFFKYTFQEQWNRSMHAEGVYHAVEFMREHKENIEKNIGETDKGGRLRSERLLDELELKASDIEFNAAGELVLNDKTERAIVQFVEEALAHPDPGSNPMWMNDPRWALIAQMKRFTFAQTRFILDRGINELKLGNAFPLAPALIAMPWMMAADSLRDVLKGTEGYQAKSALDYATHAMERASLFGRAQFGMDALNAAGRGGSPVEAVAGPTAEMFGNIARGAHNGHLIDTMLGYVPGGGVVQAVAY